MSNDTDNAAPPCRSLAEYIHELVTRLAAADANASARLRQVVGRLSARIELDDDAVLARFENGALSLTSPSAGEKTDGVGRCDRHTVLDMLDGYLEVTDAIQTGRLYVAGSIDAVQRIFLAIEILLDGTARAPALRALADDYRRDPCLPSVDELFPDGRPRRTPSTGSDAELDLLDRLDLLPP